MNIKMKITAVVFMILFLFPACIFADSTAGLSRFYQEYSVVNHSLMSDQGCLNELMELRSLDKNAADHIADFWMFKAKRECYDYVEKIKARIDFKDLYKEIEFYVDKVATNKYDEIKKEAKKEAEQCRYCVYYDNWESINKMILDKLKAVKEESTKKHKKEMGSNLSN